MKAKANVTAADLKSLRALAEEDAMAQYVCVSLDPRRRTVDGIAILPYREFLAGLWAGDFG